jgi:hypothetical protein
MTPNIPSSAAPGADKAAGCSFLTKTEASLALRAMGVSKDDQALSGILTRLADFLYATTGKRLSTLLCLLEPMAPSFKQYASAFDKVERGEDKGSFPESKFFVVDKRFCFFSFFPGYYFSLKDEIWQEETLPVPDFVTVVYNISNILAAKKE